MRCSGFRKPDLPSPNRLAADRFASSSSTTTPRGPRSSWPTPRGRLGADRRRVHRPAGGSLGRGPPRPRPRRRAFVDPERDDCGMAVVRWIVEGPEGPSRKDALHIHSHNLNAATMMGFQMSMSGFKVEIRPFGAVEEPPASLVRAATEKPLAGDHRVLPTAAAPRPRRRSRIRVVQPAASRRPGPPRRAAPGRPISPGCTRSRRRSLGEPPPPGVTAVSAARLPIALSETRLSSSSDCRSTVPSQGVVLRREPDRLRERPVRGDVPCLDADPLPALEVGPERQSSSGRTAARRRQVDPLAVDLLVRRPR